MLFSTFYFSGTGNTKWAAEKFNQIVGTSGNTSVIYAITDKEIQDTGFLKDIINKSDYIGFANPIYGANIPPVMARFVKLVISCLENTTGMKKPIYIINTFGYINGFGPFAASKLFAKTGFKLVSYVNIRLCNNISTPKIKTKPIAEAELVRRKQNAEQILKKTVTKILGGKRFIMGIGPYLIPGIIIRKTTSKGVENNYLALSINSKTCTKCMKCVNECPAHSILFSNDDGFKFLPSCTACMRCYNFCPTASVLFDGYYADPEIYPRYRGPKIGRNLDMN